MERRDLEQLEAVLDLVQHNLGDDLLAAYHHGSAVTSGLRPSSDLDVFVLMGRATHADERRGLVRSLLEVSGRRGTRIAGRPIEMTVARRDAIAPWPAEPWREFQYGEWLRDEYEAGLTPEPVIDHDLAPLVATLLAGSVPLLGPPAEQLIDPVPHAALVASMRRSVGSLLAELEHDTCNVLLTLARLWCTITTGDIVSKDAAADRAQAALATELRGPLEHARRVYLGELPPAFDELPSGVTQTAHRLAELIANGPVPGA